MTWRSNGTTPRENTPYVVAGQKETRQLETLHDFKVEMTHTNGQVGKHAEFRLSSRVSKRGSWMVKEQWKMI